MTGNLSGPHTLDQVHWPEDKLDQYATRLKPVELVRIRLPADSYAKQFGLSTAQVDGWHKRAKGEDPPTDRTSTNNLDQRLGGKSGPGS